MPGKPPGHFQKVTPIPTFYWLPPWPGVHSMAGQFVQTFYELLVMAHKGKEGLNLHVDLWWCTFSDGL